MVDGPRSGRWAFHVEPETVNDGKGSRRLRGGWSRAALGQGQGRETSHVSSGRGIRYADGSERGAGWGWMGKMGILKWEY